MTQIQLHLKQLRAANRMTQAELAERAGIDQARISRMESGEGRTIGLDALGRLCDALDCEPGDLLERVGQKRRRRS